MTEKIIGSTKAIIPPTAAVTSLRIKDNYSFFAIPSEILEKYQVKEFDIIESDNELMMVARKTEATSESNKPTPTKMEVV